MMVVIATGHACMHMAMMFKAKHVEKNSKKFHNYITLRSMYDTMQEGVVQGAEIGKLYQTILQMTDHGGQ